MPRSAKVAKPRMTRKKALNAKDSYTELLDKYGSSSEAHDDHHALGYDPSSCVLR